jgi:hypothetical protein
MKIHEGCTAIVIGGHAKENIGKITKVGKYIGTAETECGRTMGGDDQWAVETEMVSTHGIKNHFQREINLSKIDDVDLEVEEMAKEVENEN